MTELPQCFFNDAKICDCCSFECKEKTLRDYDCVNFDTFKEKYSFIQTNINANNLFDSNDILYFKENGEAIFVEFKSGGKSFLGEVRQKLAESLLIFNDFCNTNLSDTRKHLKYVLVCNQKKARELNHEILTIKKGDWFKQSERCKVFFKDFKVMSNIEFDKKFSKL